MEITKFEDIIKNNNVNKEEAMACTDKFYGLLGMEPGSEIMNLPQVVGSLFSNKKFLAIQMPLKDKEIGALCFKGNYEGGYILINSSLPKYNVNFALCHEVCHVCINSDMDNNTAEVYIDDTYLDHKNERIANQFAGMILMPERHIRRMFEKFSSEIGQNTDSNTSVLILICKLMSYFKAPYMAVLIRLTELELIKSRDILKTLLGIQPEDIERIYSNQWLDTMELKPSYRDDFDRLRELVVSAGEDNIEQELIYESDLSESLKNLDNIYLQIREEL